MIKMKIINGRYCPVVFCDNCKGVIEESGNILFNEKGKILGHYHKGICDPHSKDALWTDLDVFLARLIHNSKVDYEKTIKKIKDFEGLI